MSPFLAQHGWVALAALVVGLLVRFSKADNRIPFTIPPRLRSGFAIVLGLAAGVLHKVIAGGDASPQAWIVALLDGLTIGGGAIVGHDVVIESILSGNEIPMPGLMKPAGRIKSPPPLTADEHKDLK